MIVTYFLDSSTLPDPLECKKELQKLPEERVEKINRLKHPDMRRQSFGAGLLLDHGLRKCGCRKPEIRYNAYGKPYVDQVPFNLSHSGGCIILSTCRKDTESPGNLPIKETAGADGNTGCEIGCDIEQIQIKKYNPKIAERFFTKAEYQNLQSITDRQLQAELFFRYWTRKESVLKLAGLGMALPMDLFDVTSEEQPAVCREKAAKWFQTARDREKPEYRQAETLLLDRQLYFQGYFYENCCITVCSTQKQFQKEIAVQTGL